MIGCWVSFVISLTFPSTVKMAPWLIQNSCIQTRRPKLTWSSLKKWQQDWWNNIHNKLFQIKPNIGKWKSSFRKSKKKYEVHKISFQTFFVWAFKIVVDSWKFSMLLLYILWDDWPILWFQVQMNSYRSNWNTPY